MNTVVLHQGAIGDFVLALSVIQSVRACVNAGRVLAIASAASARFAAGRSVIDEWLSPESAALHTLFREGTPDSRLADPLNDANLILSFLSAPSEELHDRLVRFTSARVISLDPRPTAETLARRTHITAQWTTAIREQGLAIPDPTAASINPSLGGRASCPPAFPPLARGGLEGTSPRILIHPGAGSPTKCWSADRYAALADALAKTSGPAELAPSASEGSKGNCTTDPSLALRASVPSSGFRPGEAPGHPTIHWMLGPAELECNPARFAPIRERIAIHNEPLLIEEDLLRAAGHIAGMDLYIGNDAGMTHIAAALGIPTVAIYGPTDPNIWRPLGDHVMTIGLPTPSPITTVTVEEVLSKLRID